MYCQELKSSSRTPAGGRAAIFQVLGTQGVKGEWVPFTVVDGIFVAVYFVDQSRFHVV